MMRKKKKPTTFVPPPVAVLPANGMSASGNGGKMSQPFWKRPLPRSGSSENENDSICSRVDIQAKLQEKKRQQLAELRVIEEEIKQGKLKRPAQSDVSETGTLKQPIPRSKKQPWPSGPIVPEPPIFAYGSQGATNLWFARFFCLLNPAAVLDVRRIRTPEVPFQNTRDPLIAASFGEFAHLLRLLRPAVAEWTFVSSAGHSGTVVWRNRCLGSDVHGDVIGFQRRHLQVVPHLLGHGESSVAAQIVHFAARIQIQKAEIAQGHPLGAFHPFDQFQRW